MGYSTASTPPEWIEEYLRVRAARYLGVAPWDERLDDPYWINLALASENAEGEAREHLSRKSSL